MVQLAIIPEITVREIITRAKAFEAVRSAFESVAANESRVFDVVAASGFNTGEGCAVKSGGDRQNLLLGLKVGTYWPGNFDRGLPAHGSTVLLLDPETGFPQAIVSAAYLNGFRTAAANAIAVTYLGRKDAKVLGVIGAGHQAEHEIRAVAEVRSLSLIKISTRSEERAAWITERLQDMEVDIRMTTAEEAVRESDLVTTVTPSTAALVHDEWVEAGTHISAMGADAVGKQELDANIMRRARLFADYPAQSVKIGEFQHAFQEGIISGPDAISPIGSVTKGEAPGRSSGAEITVFDSSGIAIQDLNAAHAILEAAERDNKVHYIEF